MITGQLVTVRQYYPTSGALAYQGRGQVVGFTAACCNDGFGAVSTDQRVVVLCADGRFRFCQTVDVRALDVPAELAEAA